MLAFKILIHTKKKALTQLEIRMTEELSYILKQINVIKVIIYEVSLVNHDLKEN